MNDKITLEELRQTELYRKEQTRPLREFLGKEMKQEPVAWLCQNIDGTYDALSDKGCAECFPVYTAPRQLSDEEIWKIYNITGLGNGMALRFARAILKKASEK